MDKLAAPIPSAPPQPAVESPVSAPAESSGRRWLLWSAIGLTFLIFGTAIGIFSAKFFSQSPSSSQLTLTPTPILSPTPSPDLYREPDGSAATADWKTYTNSVYQYSISAPSDFSLRLCSDCQPPEVMFSLQNSSNSISLTIEYAHQFSITANLSSKPNQTHNLKLTIQGRSYTPEEYYVTAEKYYIFKIDDVSKNGQPSQISIAGGYRQLEEAQLVSQILSTFKFTD